MIVVLIFNQVTSAVFSLNINTMSLKTFQAKWRGLLHHITNKHEWLLGDDGRPGACDHGDLEEQSKPWLESGCKSHMRLREIIFDKR